MKTKLLLLTLLFSSILSAQTMFYDFNTDQFGISIQQEYKLSEPVRAYTAIRHQKYLTSFDLMVGRTVYYGLFDISMFIGLTGNTTHKVSLGGTAIGKISYYITRNVKASIHYQPVINDNIFPYQWQHQIGTGINIEL